MWKLQIALIMHRKLLMNVMNKFDFPPPLPEPTDN